MSCPTCGHANRAGRKFCVQCGSALVGQPLYFFADEPHATLSIAHSFGTLAQGGGEFESVYAMIVLYGRDDLAGVEIFETDDLDAALARFEELRPSQT